MNKIPILELQLQTQFHSSRVSRQQVTGECLQICDGYLNCVQLDNIQLSEVEKCVQNVGGGDHGVEQGELSTCVTSRVASWSWPHADMSAHRNFIYHLVSSHSHLALDFLVRSFTMERFEGTVPFSASFLVILSQLIYKKLLKFAKNSLLIQSK